MTVTKASVFVIILVALFFGYRVWKTEEAELATVPAVEATPEREEPTVAIDSGAEIIPEFNDASLPALDKPGCLTVKQFEELPEFRQDAERIESVSAAGAALTPYEALGEETLRSFVEQGDAAAMVVLGAMNVMRAYGLDDMQAIDWLNGKHSIADIHVGTNDLPGSASLALNEAAYWFYEAAAHGRVMALQYHGQVKGRLFGGPVGLGWINQEDYDALSVNETNSLNPNNLFGQVAYDVVPELREGPIGSVLSGLSPQSAKQREIRRQLQIEFSTNLEERGLPPVQVAPTATTSMEDLFDRICDSVKHEELRRRSLQ